MNYPALNGLHYHVLDFIWQRGDEKLVLQEPNKPINEYCGQITYTHKYNYAICLQNPYIIKTQTMVYAMWLVHA